VVQQVPSDVLVNVVVDLWAASDRMVLIGIIKVVEINVSLYKLLFHVCSAHEVNVVVSSTVDHCVPRVFETFVASVCAVLSFLPDFGLVVGFFVVL